MYLILFFLYVIGVAWSVLELASRWIDKSKAEELEEEIQKKAKKRGLSVDSYYEAYPVVSSMFVVFWPFVFFFYLITLFFHFIQKAFKDSD
jgi:hypothetical protein